MRRGWFAAVVVMQATAAGAAPFAWLGHETTATVSRLDLATHTTVTIAVGDDPVAVAASLDGKRAYVANQVGQSVTVIDAPTAAVVTTIPLVSNPSGIAVRPDGAKVYVANTDGTVSVIDTAALAVVKTIPVGGTLITAVANHAGTAVYITKVESVRSVAVIDTATDTLSADVFTSSEFSYAYGLAVSTDDTRVYSVALIAAAVDVIDATTNLLLGTIPLTLPESGYVSAAALALSPNGQRAYVAEFGTGSVAVLDTAAMTELTTVPVGVALRSIDVTPDGSRVYVASNADPGALSIIDPATNTVTGTVLTLDPFPVALGRFIAPGPASTAPPILSAAVRTCQKTLAQSFQRFAAKAHPMFTACFGSVLTAVAIGSGVSRAAAVCVANLAGGVPASKLARLRVLARTRALGPCATLTPSALANPCDPAATTIAAVIDCVLDAQQRQVVAAVAAEYGSACGIATKAGIAGIHPGLCAR